MQLDQERIKGRSRRADTAGTARPVMGFVARVHAMAAGQFSERVRRSLVNRMAQRLARAHYECSKRKLQAQLDLAEMRGTDLQLLEAWRRAIAGEPFDCADD